MTTHTRKTIVQSVLLALIFVLGMSGTSRAAEYWLKAEVATKTMPDTSVITMWGFAQCTDGTFAACSAATVPGPALIVPPADTTLTIHLRNDLTGPFVEPVSIIIPGQTTALSPVKFTDAAGRQRVQSFTAETPPDGTTVVDYIWNNLKSGTYLYQSGSHPAVQVQMGLYGAMTKDATTGQAYGASTAYYAEAVLLFSEIDPLLHIAVAMGNYGPGLGITSTMNYEPKYFLINGEPYSAASSPIAAGVAGQNILLRFLNAGLKPHVPAIQGLYMSIIAEDGNAYANAKQQYSLLLPAGKTMDAIMTPTTNGTYAVYDRKLALTNAAASGGGMLTYLNVAQDMPPTGSVVINGDAATAYSRYVTLTLSATDAETSVTNMRLSWDNVVWYAWETYATTRNATIPGTTAGPYTIYVQFRDSAGNMSIAYSDSIQYISDTTPPTGSVVINSDAATTSSIYATLTLSATDTESAVTNRRFSWDNVTWYGWEAYATTRNVTIPAGDGTKTIYVQFRDAAGNVSLVYSDSILLDQTAPTGSVVINGDAPTTNSRAVTLTLSATDTANAVTNMRFSWNGTTFFGWEAYATTRNATIPGTTAGTYTISVQFRDAAGNVSTAYSDSIDYAP